MGRKFCQVGKLFSKGISCHFGGEQTGLSAPLSAVFAGWKMSAHRCSAPPGVRDAGAASIGGAGANVPPSDGRRNFDHGLRGLRGFTDRCFGKSVSSVKSRKSVVQDQRSNEFRSAPPRSGDLQSPNQNRYAQRRSTSSRRREIWRCARGDCRRLQIAAPWGVTPPRRAWRGNRRRCCPRAESARCQSGPRSAGRAFSSPP